MRFVTIVPSCPKCGSCRTGRYVYYSGRFPERLIAQYMRKGELIRTSSGFGGSLCFCGDCGLEWYGDPQTKLLSGRQIRARKEDMEITRKEIEEVGDRKFIKMDMVPKRKGILHRVGAFTTHAIYNSTVGAVIEALPKEKPEKKV